MERYRAREILQHIDVIKAYADGKTIEFQGEQTGEWLEASEPQFSGNTVYRVKPEPKRVPLEMADVICGKTLVGRTGQGHALVLSVNKGGVVCAGMAGADGQGSDRLWTYRFATLLQKEDMLYSNDGGATWAHPSKLSQE